MSTGKDIAPTPTADDVWRTLELRRSSTAPTFDPANLADLPTPVRCWLGRVVPAGTPLTGPVVLTMEGEIRLGPKWFDFRADQILHPGVGFVWRPVVGGRLLRFTGADLLVDSEARMEFRLHGRVPVVSASGDDVARSAAGRLAAETVVWAPQAITPQSGARWRIDDRGTPVVSLTIADHVVDVEVDIDDAGVLRSLSFDRWDASASPPRMRRFGGSTTSELVTPAGVSVSGSGAVGWDWGTPAWTNGEFFRYRVLSCARLP